MWNLYTQTARAQVGTHCHLDYWQRLLPRPLGRCLLRRCSWRPDVLKQRTPKMAVTRLTIGQLANLKQLVAARTGTKATKPPRTAPSAHHRRSVEEAVCCALERTIAELRTVRLLTVYHRVATHGATHTLTMAVWQRPRHLLFGHSHSSGWLAAQLLRAKPCAAHCPGNGQHMQAHNKQIV